MRSLFSSVYAPSTLGSFLRTFTHGHVRQLQAAARDTLIGLAARAPILAGADVLTFVDIDSMLRRVYGKKKQGTGFGHVKVGGYNAWLRGHNPLITTLSTPLTAPVIAATRLRSGNTDSSRGAASMIAEVIGTARACGTTGEIVVRATRRCTPRPSVGVRVNPYPDNNRHAGNSRWVQGGRLHFGSSPAI